LAAVRWGKNSGWKRAKAAVRSLEAVVAVNCHAVLSTLADVLPLVKDAGIGHTGGKLEAGGGGGGGGGWGLVSIT